MQDSRTGRRKRLIRYHASWILPISEPPIRDGWLAVDHGRVVALGSAGKRVLSDGAAVVDLGDVAVLPGLVNAHTHLELSYLRDQVPPASQFVTWVRGVMKARRERPDSGAKEILDAVDDAIAEAVACGTAIVGDISNTLVTFGPLSRSSLAAVVFYELIRFNTPDPAGVVAKAMTDLSALPQTERVRAGLAAHAPYSVAPLVMRAIRQAVDRDPFMPCSIHLSESVE
ncbi:MAG TPA: amidohydrolase family protein, partial [Vicinamibacterales bacterium]|nr:amidohydrolase family protein [Vicinamibacterales bacterium]